MKKRELTHLRSSTVYEIIQSRHEATNLEEQAHPNQASELLKQKEKSLRMILNTSQGY